MLTATTALYHRASMPLRLQVAAVAAFAGSFVIVAAYGGHSLGLSGAFYIPIVLASLASGPLGGAVAGVAATILFVGGLDVSRAPAADVVSLRTAIHLTTFVAAGLIVGLFASRARRMLGESLHLLDDLLGLAHRDLDSGALSGEGFEAAVQHRVSSGRPFLLLVAELADSRGRPVDEAGLRHAIELVCSELGPDTEIARVGPARIAVVAVGAMPATARLTAGDLERSLQDASVRATFGWALHPLEGEDTLALFSVASERLHGRRFVRGEWLPTAASVDLVEELVARPS